MRRTRLTTGVWTGLALVLALVIAWPLGTSAAAPTAGPLPLTQNFIAKGGVLTFSYPQGWVHGTESGAITLGNNQAALDNISGKAQPGEVAVLIWPTTADAADTWGVTFEGKSHQEILQELMDQSSNTRFTQQPTATTVGDMKATRVMATSDGRDTLVLLVDTGADNVTAVAAGTVEGELTQHEATVLAIAATLSYHGTPAAASSGQAVATPGSAVAKPGSTAGQVAWQTFVSDDGQFTFSYPQGWVHGTENGAITVANSQAALDNVNGQAVPGELAILIWPMTADVAKATDVSPDAKNHQELLKELMALGNHPTFSEGPTEITVGGKPATKMKGQEGGRDTLMLLVDTGPNNVSTIMAGATPGEMPQLETTVLAIAASLAYGGTGAAPAGESAAGDGLVRQWASQAEATSEYGLTEWNALQATGAPNTQGCEDSKLAWAALNNTTQETLTLHYDKAVTPAEVNIHETYTPGAITEVELIPADGGAPVAVPNSADPDTTCPHVFQLKVPAGMAPVNGVVIHVDQSIVGSWAEIDAVELVGK